MITTSAADGTNGPVLPIITLTLPDAQSTDTLGAGVIDAGRMSRITPAPKRFKRVCDPPGVFSVKVSGSNGSLTMPGSSSPDLRTKRIVDAPPTTDADTRKIGFFASAKGSALLALFSVLSASFISVCSTLILEQVNALWNRDFSGTFVHLIFATITSLIALWVVWRREQGLNALTYHKEADLDRQRQEMEGRLTNLPPRQFVEEYVVAQETIGKLRQLTKNDLANTTREQIIERTQVMLASILSLTRLWDGVSETNKHVIYHANIMRAFSSEEVAVNGLVLPPTPAAGRAATDDIANNAGTSYDSAPVEATISTGAQERSDQPQQDADDSQSAVGAPEWFIHDHFFLHNQNYQVALERCSGILFLEMGLTLTSKASTAPNANVQPILLPYTVSEEFDDTFHHPNLPGAPRVAASGEPEYLTNTADVVQAWIADQLPKAREINGRYQDKIREYYSELQHARSIVSMPIYHEDVLIGVLNVSKNAERMLLNADRAALFTQFMIPICYHLGKMLVLLGESSVNRCSNVQPEVDHEQ